MLELDPTRPASPPRAAATTLIVRDGTSGVEVFCVVRHPKSSFLGGVVAFPGGKVDPSDGSPELASIATPLDPRVAALAELTSELPLPSAPSTLVMAACREALEEGAILPVEGDALDDAGVLALRTLLAGGASLGAELRALGLRLDAGRLRAFGRWVTPEAEPRRYDATFFLLPLPPGQVGTSDAHETTSVFWETPAGVLTRWASGEVQLAPPTARSLELLSGCRSVAEALAVAAKQSLLPVCPRFVPDERAPFLALPGDPTHAVPDRRVDGPTRFVLRDGRFVSEDPP